MDKSFHFMHWVKPSSAVLMDKVSKVPLSHITLLCKNMICVECNCSKCVGNLLLNFTHRFDFLMKSLNEHTSLNGSVAEGCTLPPYWSKNRSTGKYIQQESDFDMMVPAMNLLTVFSVDFKREVGISAIIETRHTSPGYLRLRDLRGKYISSQCNKVQLYDGYPFHHMRANMSEFSYLTKDIPKVHQHGPVTTITLGSSPIFLNVKQDLVQHYPCSAWPPEAEPWVTRHRPSNWPTREIVERIVSMGCSVVPKPHPLNYRTAGIEFRFSFSNAETILFQGMSVEQRNCFKAFKALVKRAREEMEECQEEMGNEVSTYHSKTIFLWACETIDIEEWGITCGWANCLLYLFDQLILCLEHKSLPSFFIPQCNLLEGIKRTSNFKMIVERVRSKPLKYAMEFLTSMKSFELSRYNDYITAAYIDILNKSSFQSAAAYIISNIGLNSEKNPDIHPSDCQYNTCLQELEDNEKTAKRFHENERKFLQTFFQNIDGETESQSADMFRRKPCCYLASFANWCKENKDQRIPLFKELTILDVIILNNVHGLSIPYNTIVDFVERDFHNRVCSGNTSNLESRESVICSKTHLILYSMHVGELERAKDEIYSVLMDNNFEGENEVYFNIEQIVVETGYKWLFTDRTRNCIQEFENVFDFCGDSVSAEVFYQFLLSMCHTKLGEIQELECQLSDMLRISFRNSHSIDYFEMLLIGEVAGMAGNNILASEIYKSSRMINVRAIDELYHAKPRTTVRHWNISCDSNVKGFLGMIYKTRSEEPGYFLLFAFRYTLVSMKDYNLLHSGWFTMADAVYIGQHMIYMKSYQKAISMLENVVSTEFHHPLSVTIWPIELIGLVDDDVKSEILKSPDDCIVVPSVVYSLYLLANVYRLIGDKMAAEDTQIRLEDVCDHLGEDGDTSISHTLLKLVQNV